MSEPKADRKMSTASERMARRAMLKARLNARSPVNITERQTSDAETTITPKRPSRRPISPGPTFLDVEAAASPFTRCVAEDTSIEQVMSNNASRHSSARRRSSVSPGLEDLPVDASRSERAERRRRIAEKAEELLSKGVPQRESGRVSGAASRSSSAYLDNSNPFGDSASKFRRSSIQEGEEESGRASAPLDDSYTSFGCEKYEEGRYSPTEGSPISVAVRRLSTENIKVPTPNNNNNNNNSNNSNHSSSSSGSNKGLRARDPNSANRVVDTSKECPAINNIQAENDEVEQSNKMIMDVDSPRAGRVTQPFDGTSRSARGDNNNEISAAAVVAAASDIRLPSPSPHQQDESVERAFSVASDVPVPQEKTASPDRTRDDHLPVAQEQSSPAQDATPAATTLAKHVPKEHGSMSTTPPPEMLETTEKAVASDSAAPPVPLQEQGAAVPIRVAKESPSGEGIGLLPGKKSQNKKSGNDKDTPLIDGDDDEGSGSHSNKNRKGKKNNKRDIIVPGSEVKEAQGSEEPQCCPCCKCCNCCCKCCRSCCSRCCRSCEIM